ncbi:hypothetical protein [Burkholderia stagnalis]|uniref:hypothetical protein n=1 Tax=Burkholderia stagnalis TaxID=1503054 RepID=UPI000ACDAFC9|nr:hypothetical protein [Burkholderia stagnalis]
MFGSNSLEIATGLVFIYLSISLVCSSITEAIAWFLNHRGKTLCAGIKNLLNDPSYKSLAQQLYSHGLVCSISQYAAIPARRNRWPSYMSSGTFAHALVDMLSSRGAAISPDLQGQAERCKEVLHAAQQEADPAARQAAVAQARAELQEANARLQDAHAAKAAFDVADRLAKDVVSPAHVTQIQAATDALSKALEAGRRLAAAGPDPLADIEAAVRSLPVSHTRESLLLLLANARRDVALMRQESVLAEQHVAAFIAHVDAWYVSVMHRVSGWYKRWSQIVLASIAFAIVAVANVDTILLASTLANNDALRAEMSAMAVEVVQPNPKSGADGMVPVSRPIAAPDNGAADASRHSLADLETVLGWTPAKLEKLKQPTVLVKKLVGLLLTIVAVSLGAPFWFATLSKIVNLRMSGTLPADPDKRKPHGSATHA